jgi:hypothetical protein
MKTRILTKTKAIRSKVRYLLGDAEDQRVIAVAYVGADALSFLPDPSGIVIYCWPQAGGTNPSAIEDLVRSGAEVHFVRQLHAKVYWSRTRGALVGSANLTANALGEGGLQEVAVFLPRNAFDMDSFRRALDRHIEPDFAATLKKLHVEHVRFLQRNRSESRPATPRSPVPSFVQWLATKGGADWRMGWCVVYPDPPSDALKKLEEETGSQEWANYRAYNGASYLKCGGYTLSFGIREERGGVRIDSLRWWCPDRLIPTKDKSWKDTPYLWFSGVWLPRGAKRPFKVNQRFRRALEAAINDMGGLEWLVNDAPFKPTKSFLEKLKYHYEKRG